MLHLNNHSLLSATNTMNEFGASEIFIVIVVALIFGLGIYTLLKFRKNKNF
jgi:hypothetical protein